MLSDALPADAEAGAYTLSLKAGTYPSAVLTAASFTIEKTSETGAAGWFPQVYDNPYPVLSSIFFVDDQHGWIAGSRNTLLVTDDGGDNGYPQTSPTSANYAGVYFIDTENGWAVGEAGMLYATVNGGATWAQQSTGVTPTLNGLWFADRNNGWAVGVNGTVIHTTDGGNSWTPQDTGVGTGYSFSAVRFVSVSEGWISGGSGTSGAVLHTEDGGSTWSLQEVGDANYLYDIAFTDDQNGWAAGLYWSIIHTETGGR